MDSNKNIAPRGASRRELLTSAVGAAAMATLFQPSLIGPAKAQAPSPAAARAPGGAQSRPNIVFIFTNQERYQIKWPAGLSLPGHERLQRTGVSFNNHYCPAVACSSSRSVLLTGLQTPDNGVFENLDFPWGKNLSPKISTIGHMLRKAGYYTAYKGKWHLTREFENVNAAGLFTKEMEQYGFSDYTSLGDDIIGHTHGAFQFDHLIAGSALTWLRRRGRVLADDGKPWCLFVSLVNPHDVMYFNTDLPGQKVQDTGNLFYHAARAPDHELYRATWDVPLPKSLNEPFEAPGRPKAHGEFFRAWNYILGHIPPEEERWRRFNDYYVNCMRDVDAKLLAILQELDALRLADRTVVVYTSDHGELAGAHGLHGKGPVAYQEQLHLPFYIVHPDVKSGQDCNSLTGHIDAAPTLLAMAGATATQSAEFARRKLPGKDITSLLTNPGSADVHAVRDGVLFVYSCLAGNDAELIRHVSEARAAGKRPAIALLKERYVPNLKKRGSMRTVFDGRYKFSRYFSPLERNRPTTIDELYRWNDVELFDLASDPGETTNLANDKTANRDLIVQQSGKLEAQIKAEIGVDDGRELPDIPLIKWTIDRVS